MFLKRRSFFEKYEKILYLPIEIHSRELHAKLHLAYQACQRGWVVVIGPEYDVNKLAKYLPSGVYFGNGFHKKATKISKILKKSGHFVILQDEEGLVRWEPNLYKEYRINPDVCDFVDYFLCWGSEDKEIIKSAFKKSIKAKEIGNLRFDLLSPNIRELFLENLDEIKKNNGDFILINGNFGSTNHTLGEDYYLNEIKLRGWLDNPSKKEYQLKRVNFQRKIFEKMINLSITIAKSGQKVVVRPHPSESIEVWKKATENYSKYIKVIRSGSIVPWLMAAKLIIHNGCNTAIEGLILDRTIISYRPYKDSEVETYLPNAISICLETEEKIINYINNFDKHNSRIERNKTLNILENYLKINKLQEDASSRILNIIENVSQKKRTNKIKLIKENIQLEIALFKSLIGRIIYKKNFSYLKKKCPELNIKQVNKILGFFSVNKKDHFKVETLNITKHSVIISSKFN